MTSVAHCMTRLRLGLRDRSLVQEEALKALPAVMGVVEDDTYQIVLGPGTVARVTPSSRPWSRRSALTSLRSPTLPPPPRAGPTP